jgi:hypothetical protein
VWRRRVPALANVADSKPKQFHKLVNDKTLLTNTLERVDHKGDGLRYLPTRIVGGIGVSNRC